MAPSTTRNLRSGLKRGVGSGIKVAAAAADRVRPPRAGVTVLIYHRVGGGSDSDVDLAPHEFERQLQHLVEHHQVLDLGAFQVDLGEVTFNGMAAIETCFPS